MKSKFDERAKEIETLGFVYHSYLDAFEKQILPKIIYIPYVDVAHLNDLQWKKVIKNVKENKYVPAMKAIRSDLPPFERISLCERDNDEKK